MSANVQIKQQEITFQNELLDEIEQARKDWVLAHDQLNYILDPDLIDHAIYILDAAEKKYCFLLREARRLGVRASTRR